LNKPLLLDGFCGGGGATKGYQLAGFHVVGIDNRPQPRYVGDAFLQMDFLEALAMLADGTRLTFSDGHAYSLHEFDAIHASPPCQGYSIMHNLPWLRGRKYPLLILPTIEVLDAIGKPYVIENVMGARHGAAGLKKRGIEAHGLKAGWLCGAMFGLPFYRHRLFATNWFWLAPGHPKHKLNLHPRSERWVYGGTVKGLPGGSAGLDTKPSHPNPVNSAWPGRRDQQAGLANWQNGNGAQANGVGVGHAKGWRLAAEAMQIDWPVTRAELTQMIPPVYSKFIGRRLMEATGATP